MECGPSVGGINCAGDARKAGDAIEVAAALTGIVSTTIGLGPNGVVVSARLDAEDGAAEVIVAAGQDSLVVRRNARDLSFFLNATPISDSRLGDNHTGPVGMAIVVDEDGGARVLFDAPVTLCTPPGSCLLPQAPTTLLNASTATVTISLEGGVASPVRVQDLSFIVR